MAWRSEGLQAMSRSLTVSLGKKDHPAKITRTWSGPFDALVSQLLGNVRVSTDKAAGGWICGAEFKGPRHGDNFVARHLLSFDYDHLPPEAVPRVLDACKGTAHLAYTTWSHTAESPRLRIWIPLLRPVSDDEFQAVSRKVADRSGIELAARESHAGPQFMWRPCHQEGAPFEVWKDTESPYLDVDKVLAEYWDWQDRTEWPHCSKADECHNTEIRVLKPLDKPGVIGLFNRTFTITAAIERFGLPYRRD